MVAGVNGPFRRGLSDEFVSALRNEADKGGWWTDVLADRGLLIAVRDEYLNVYWRGQSLFRVHRNGKALAAWTHPKYLLNPALSRPVRFDGRAFRLGDLSSRALTQEYEDNSTLEMMKKAAGIYSNSEKIGVHAIATTNSSVVDVEIAFRNGGDAKRGKLPRADIAVIEPGADNEARLVFWEAKLYRNKELRSDSGKAQVFGQIEKYRTVISAHREALIGSYKRVAQNLIDIADMGPSGLRKVSQAVRGVATGDLALGIDDPPDVGLIVFGFDQAQRADAIHRASLIDAIRFKALGDAGAITL